jgi:SAM-dependent methyltransferase
MLLNNEIKSAIYAEYNSFKNEMYAGKSLEERKQLDQFFTPPELTIQMIEKFDCDTLNNKRILDPTSGSGNLLAACLIAGADADKVFGNDYDADMVNICRKRLSKLCKQLNKKGFKDWQIHQGNALQRLCLIDFSPDYEKNYQIKYIDDLDYAQNNYNDARAKVKAEQQNQTKEELW